jgi:hypothetical protein
MNFRVLALMLLLLVLVLLIPVLAEAWKNLKSPGQSPGKPGKRRPRNNR